MCMRVKMIRSRQVRGRNWPVDAGVLLQRIMDTAVTGQRRAPDPSLAKPDRTGGNVIALGEVEAIRADQSGTAGRHRRDP